MRPATVAVVTGTATEVGKTWVAAALLKEARRGGLSVAARKPAQSYPSGTAITDGQVLAEASGEHPDEVCPAHRSYPLAVAPPMAAARLGRPVPTVADLAAELSSSWPDMNIDLGVIEGAGGVASPLADDGDNAALARAVGADAAILVADPDLGVLNSVRLALLALAGIPTVVYLNRFDPAVDLHRWNRDWLTARDRLQVMTTPASLLDWLGRTASRNTAKQKA
ncbi:MAG: dethiobiotin synthase [Acidimicrobiales bacterium]|nr:dethiobiotin synthase [Acidimicrobiales bacterium]